MACEQLSLDDLVTDVCRERDRWPTHIDGQHVVAITYRDGQYRPVVEIEVGSYL